MKQNPEHKTRSTDHPQAETVAQTSCRDSRYEVAAHRSGPRLRVRYREGSVSPDDKHCRLCN